MTDYVITYVQELTQPIAAPTIAEAADYAWKYATKNRLRVLSVYRKEDDKGLPPKLAA